jgi:hypothetical protein
MTWIWIAVALGLALGCGRYGAPIRPEPKPVPAAAQSDTRGAPDDAPGLAEPDFRLDLPGIPGSDDDE